MVRTLRSKKAMPLKLRTAVLRPVLQDGVRGPGEPGKQDPRRQRGRAPLARVPGAGSLPLCAPRAACTARGCTPPSPPTRPALSRTADSAHQPALRSMAARARGPRHPCAPVGCAGCRVAPRGAAPCWRQRGSPVRQAEWPARLTTAAPAQLDSMSAPASDVSRPRQVELPQHQRPRPWRPCASVCALRSALRGTCAFQPRPLADGSAVRLRPTGNRIKMRPTVKSARLRFPSSSAGITAGTAA